MLKSGRQWFRPAEITLSTSRILLIVECKAGYMKDATTGECTICPKNTYSEDEDSTECKSCPTGEITTSEGSSRKQKCHISEW